jgi:putative DNA primase/helicase
MTNVAEFKAFHDLLMSGAPDDFRPFLFPLEARGKDPLVSRGSWSNAKNCLSYYEAIRFLEYGFNIGISAREYDQLVLIDIDDMHTIPTSDVKPTLSVVTRSRVGMHHYYFSRDIECNVNIPTDAGEIRSCNQYLVIPGSYVPTDVSTVPKGHEEQCGFYTVSNHVSPVQISYDEFPKVFRDQRDLSNQNAPLQRREPTERRSKSALFDLTIADIVNYPKNKKRFASVFHGSDTNTNTAVSGGLLHCWRHLCSHTPIQALSVLAGIYNCQQAGESHQHGGSGASMVDINDGATIYTIWAYARGNGFIPRDDPPPSAALRYFVLEIGLCGESDLEDGWKLPRDAYEEGRRLLRTNVP